jgi:raffinose/stachyose/melibiose transport system substrate-binding protein
LQTALSKKNFTNSKLLKTAKYLNTLVNDGVFQQSFLTDDTGSAQNLFAQGKSAFLYSGEWDMSMASNSSFSSDFKNNLRVTAFPAIPGGAGKATTLMAWNGGGYAISAKSPRVAAAKKLLNYMMLPTNWTKTGWQNGDVVPAQKFSTYLTGKENIVQKSLVSILNNASLLSGTDFNDCGSSQFKTYAESASQSLCSGQLTAQQFLDTLTTSIKK